jgi:hypothetical protein
MTAAGRGVARACPVGVVGGYGAVGRAAVNQFLAWGVGPVMVGGRDKARAAVVVDVDDRASLDRFCAGCQVVVNCAGPSCEVLDKVARAALENGAHYVDPGGDDAVHASLSTVDGLSAVLSAGMLPGLTGLLPRALAADGPARLTAYVGGRDRFTGTAAADYLASLRNGYGRSNAGWRGGHRAERVATPLIDAELPYFPEPVTAYPYLSTEMERLARALRLDELTFHNVFPGAHVRSALAGTDPAALVAASELDLFGREPYQRLVFELDGHTMVLSARGASQLTGATTAMAAMAVLAGSVPPGVHFAADVLDPSWAVDRLRRARAAVTALEVFTGAAAGTVEEGVL